MKPNKIFLQLLIFVLTVPSTLIANLAGASVSTPSVPQFTLQYVDHSYNIPPTYGTDQYTGKTIITSPAMHVDNRTIDVTIKYQSFTPYKDANNNTIQLYYDVRSKGHFADFTSDTDYGSHSLRGIQASTSGDTVISFGIEYWNIPLGGQIDFEAQAFIGYTYYNSGGCYTGYQVTVGQSGWSNPQTISFIGDGAVTTAEPSTPAPTTSPVPTPTASPFDTPTSTPIQTQPTPIQAQPTPIQNQTQQGPQKSLPFGGIDWQQTALIIMAALIAVLFGALAVMIRWRNSATK